MCSLSLPPSLQQNQLYIATQLLGDTRNLNESAARKNDLEKCFHGDIMYCISTNVLNRTACWKPNTLLTGVTHKKESSSDAWVDYKSTTYSNKYLAQITIFYSVIL